jgi:hypothetical protein
MPFSYEDISALRTTKIKGLLAGFAPIWLVSEEHRVKEDALIFHIVFQDPSYGWINRRYKYDAFNDVLYHMGWRLLDEDETLDIQEKTPLIDGDVASHVPNAPSYRAGGSMKSV